MSGWPSSAGGASIGSTASTRCAPLRPSGACKSAAEWIEAVDLVLLRAPILARAGDPLPTPLGTLDALHLATALAWRDRMGESVPVATHDPALGLAARALGFAVIGV